MFKIAAIVFAFALESAIMVHNAEAASPAQADADHGDCLVCQFGEPDPTYDCATGAHFDVADGRLMFVCLSDDDFSGASFRNADLSGSDFDRARLAYADFTGATLAYTHFKGADLSRAKGLTQQQLDSACGDADTKLPQGLSVKSCS